MTGLQLMNREGVVVVSTTESVRRLCHLAVVFYFLIRKTVIRVRQPCSISRTDHFGSLSAQFEAVIVFPPSPPSTTLHRLAGVRGWMNGWVFPLNSDNDARALLVLWS